LIIKNRALLALGDIKSKKNILEQLHEISNAASQAIQETRNISYNLHPYQIDRLGLRKAIESIIDRMGQTTAITFTSEIDPIDDIFPKEMGIHIYRIVQECTNNILKHADASAARITMKRLNDQLNISVEDNGKGFNASEELMRATHGFGLQGIGERARLLGGTMKIESDPGKGTKIVIAIKLYEKKHIQY
jgi:signal transduction histidine kinase